MVPASEADSLPSSRRPTFFSGALASVLDLIYPPVCSLCGELLADDRSPNKRGEKIRSDVLLLCPVCRGRIRVEESQQCPRCGGIRYYRGGSMKKCANCSTRNFHFNRVIALGEYISPMSDVILRMKKEFISVRAETFAHFLIEERGASLREVGADYVVPVPMHLIRRAIRGVNSAERIAVEIARFLGIPCFGGVIQRSRWTVRQATLPGHLRFDNVRNAFRIQKRHRFLPFLPTRSLVGKKILLVDDVLTTGATCDEIARVLREAGASSVTVAVLARAEGKRHGVPFPDEKRDRSSQ